MIRIAFEEDLDFIYGLYMHPEVNPFILYEPMDKNEFEPIYNDLVAKRIKYIYSDNDADIGMFKLIPLTYRTSHIVYLGGLAVHPDYKGRGYGKKMMNEIIEFVGRQGFLRIELSVAEINTTAISLYEKSGFTKEGLLKKFSHLKKDQRFMDEFLMAYLY